MTQTVAHNPMLADFARPLYTKAEAADVGRCSVRTVDRAIEAGLLEAVRRGNGQRLVKRDSLLRWLGLQVAS